MKKMITRAFAALIMAAGISTLATAQTVQLSTISKVDFSRVKANTTTVKMSRQLFAGYNTICLPFNVSASELQALVGEGVMLEKMVKAEANELTFLDVTSDGLQAGVPYLLYSPSKQNVVFKTQQVDALQAPITLTAGNATMSGLYEATKQAGLYGIPAQQETDMLQSILVRTDADKTFLPTRCGITFEGSSTPTIKHVTSLYNDETAISKLQAKNAKVDIYSTNGTLVKRGVGLNDAMQTLNRGVYVVNGQKFMVK